MIRKKLINRDALTSASRSAVATAMVSVFNAIQGLRNEVQLLALTGAFALMTEVTDVRPEDARVVISNLMKDPNTSTRREARFSAMKYYITEELTKGAR